ncbi:MAG TPA: o-succinylbenzoate synthase [Vicinamibacterales bacterium]|nr:o-succinylbenzoate synthase [Vicinamibacterales bacterium]
MIRIDRLQLRLVRLPLVAFFETSFGRIYDRTFILVTLHGGGLEGLGECVAEADPYYSPETNVTAWHVIRDFLAPLVLGRRFDDPREVFPALARVRGHNMAKAAIEMAAWDLEARTRGVALSRLLGGTRAAIASGVSIGIQDSLEQLAAKIRTELDAGYQRIKIKIKPGWDLAAVEMVRARFGRIPLMVDANAAYAIGDAARLGALDAFDLMMIEQPLDYGDIRDHAALQRRIRTPICLDESIHSPRAAEDAIDRGACRIVNVKPGRLGGHAESIRVHDVCAARGVPVWHGGMLESGIGRAHNVHLASLPNFSLPGDIAASRRYFVPDLIDPPIDVSREGTVAVPVAPGIGVNVDWDRVTAATVETYDVRA